MRTASLLMNVPSVALDDSGCVSNLIGTSVDSFDTEEAVLDSERRRVYSEKLSNSGRDA